MMEYRSVVSLKLRQYYPIQTSQKPLNRGVTWKWWQNSLCSCRET